MFQSYSRQIWGQSVASRSERLVSEVDKFMFSNETYFSLLFLTLPLSPYFLCIHAPPLSLLSINCLHPPSINYVNYEHQEKRQRFSLEIIFLDLSTLRSVLKDGLGMFHTEVMITFGYDALKLHTKPFAFLLAF